ncbi:hypothetical protein I302_105977 [Kwoniella bestiolae CBS 10118]|uniref:Origin recognition complex subunit 5 C-terminal domain-containing protein n=1 Tax=Kwoniella bestiolae CBS 10118 TaxID=1296100 RepID=A0A1B9G2N7_9TREE|nr:hypothetical protein I302_05101 [Kwoniella bestiolae CBS 10118]OCF25287.1 hypothetical protein I302_05101 [Kwoniella bestiolae CBS 10118]
MMNTTLDMLISHRPTPSFIYLHHPHHSSTSLPLPASSSSSSSSTIIKIDVVEYNTPRLFFSGVLNRLGANEEGQGEVQTFDGFSQRIRAWYTNRAGSENKSKGKGKAKVNGTNGHLEESGDERGFVLVVTRSERLRMVFGNGWSLITRLAELTGIPISVVLCSSMLWDHVRPIRGDAPEPVHVYLPAPSREEILFQLLPSSPHPLWPRFLDLLLSTVHSLCSPPIEEIQYLSQSLWPIYTSTLPPHYSMIHLGQPYPNPSNPPPEIEVTIKLLTDLKHQLSLSLASAIENLLPRTIGTHEFTQALLPKTQNGIPLTRSLPKPPSMNLSSVEKFLLVASYAGSYNPGKSDIRLFGRTAGVEGKRKKGGGTRRAGYGRVRAGKVPQRLLGPKPFPLDRLLALFSSLFAEHAERPEDLQASFGGELSSSEEEERDDWLPSVAEQSAKVERKRKRDNEQERRWDESVEELAMSVKVWGLILQLESQGLLKRMSPVDRLDNIMIRCEIGYETAKTLAKDLKFNLDEYLYEAAM